jgi:hypothetical protein
MNETRLTLAYIEWLERQVRILAARLDALETIDRIQRDYQRERRYGAGGWPP